MISSDDEQMMSMADILAQEENLVRVVRPGESVKGVVARKRATEILVDVGAKSEGMVDPKDLNNLSPEELDAIKVGDTIPVYVVSIENDQEETHIILSLSQARVEKDWEEAERLFAAGETFESTVIGNNKGGLIVNFGQVRGFVPGSQLVNAQFGGSNKPDRWNQLMGEKLQLKIIEVDRERNRLILSERAAAEEARKNKVSIMVELTEGDVRTGRVTSLADFGAFVDIGGVDGLIHLSELAWTRISHPREVLKVGDEIKVYILSVDLDQQRVALSLKRLQPEPWSQVFDYYEINQVVDAVITKLTNFGAFARIDDRIEGLIHISEISDKNITHPREVVSEGQAVKVRIIHIDPDRRRMGLSMKQVEEKENWATYKEEQENEDKADEETSEPGPDEEKETVEA
ncbi:MAG: S1 RNA-binding domain-containing protein [Chloroflexi bacterium]|nr:S1 RNA-binding domain-containing protein [Chloroflexota bacterium]